MSRDICHIEIDDSGLPAPTAEIEQERKVAIFDLLEDNSFALPERDGREVTHVQGKWRDGSTGDVQISPDGTGARNPAFDVTPGRLVTGLITERGVCEASAEGLAGLFPEHA